VAEIPFPGVVVSVGLDGSAWVMGHAVRDQAKTWLHVFPSTGFLALLVCAIVPLTSPRDVNASIILGCSLAALAPSLLLGNRPLRMTLAWRRLIDAERYIQSAAVKSAIVQPRAMRVIFGSILLFFVIVSIFQVPAHGDLNCIRRRSGGTNCFIPFLLFGNRNHVIIYLWTLQLWFLAAVPLIANLILSALVSCCREFRIRLWLRRRGASFWNIPNFPSLEQRQSPKSRRKRGLRRT
jgi:hypothetical protein